jgi:hypothetical protein
MATEYLPQTADVVNVLLTWAVGLVLGFAGTSIARRRPGIEFQIVAGWGALCVVLTAWGVLLSASMRLPAVIFTVTAVSSQLIPSARLRVDDWHGLGRILLLSLPLWVVVAPIRPSQPDTFLNLLPNAMYLVDYARLPTASLPPSFSYLPAAPYNQQFFTFLGSLLDHGYPPAGLSLANVLLQLAGGFAIARTLGSSVLAGSEAPSWRLTALGFLLCTLLNIGFEPRFNFSAYGETSQAVTAVLAACLFMHNQGELVSKSKPAYLLSLSLILVAMINAKQSGFGLVAALAGAAAVTGFAEPGLSRVTLLRSLLFAILPAALLFGLWRFYVAYAGVAELTPLPIANWNWGLLPDILESEGRIVANKGIYFGFVALSMLSLPLLLWRLGWTNTTRILCFHAVAVIFYNLFLLAAYLIHFSPAMSAQAHSFFRYNQHLSLVLVLALSLAVRDLLVDTAPFRRYLKLAGAAAICVALLAPIAFAQRLRFDLVMPQPLVWNLASATKSYLGRGNKIALLLPGDHGTVVKMLSVLLRDVRPRKRNLDILYRPDADYASLADAERLGYPVALISCTRNNEAVLLEHRAQGWYRLIAWRYSEEANKQKWQQILSWPPLCHRPTIYLNRGSNDDRASR